MKRLSGAVIASLLLLIPLVQAEEDSDFVTRIEMIKGDMHASLLNKISNNDDLAVIHAEHTNEIFAMIKEDIKDQALADDLSKRFDDLPNKVERSLDEYNDEINAINSMLDKVIDEVVGEKAKDPEFLMRVIINLLKDAESKYEEAVDAAGDILNLGEYQDAQSIANRANELFNSIKDSLDDNLRDELELFFGELNNAIGGVDIEDVEKPIKGIIQKLEGLLGIVSAEGTKPTIEEIRLSLDAIVHEYEEGEYDEAEELASKLYLEKYELLEDDIAAVDKELMEETEIMLRVDLRQLLKERASLDEINAKVDEIKTNLDKIEALGIGVGKDPRLDFVNNIEALLDRIVEEYEQERYDNAEKLVIEAYIDNYEFIENDVKSYDTELNEEFEELLTVELATKIKDRASIDDIKNTVDTIKAKLNIIETQVVPEFPIAMMILPAIMGIAVAIRLRKP